MTKSLSYVSNFWPGLRGHAQFVMDAANALQFKYALKISPQIALGHLLLARELYCDYDGFYFAPIPHHTWAKMGGPTVWKALQAEGIITVRDYSHSGSGVGVCRSFRINDSWYNDYQCAGMATEDDFRTYNIHTGKVTSKRLKTRLNDDNNNPYFAGNERCQEALRILSQSLCPVDKDTAKLETTYIMEEVRYSRCDSDHKRLSVALKSISRVLTSAGSKDEYQPAYKVTFSGRMSEIGSGLQGAPQRVKYAAFGGMIERGEAYNYDMATAQARILLRILNAWNKKQIYMARMGNRTAMPVIQVEMLERFCRDKVFRDRVFKDLEDAGAPPEHTKQIFYAVIMGMSTREASYPDAPLGLAEYIKCPRKRKAVAGKLSWLKDIMTEANKMLRAMIYQATEKRWAVDGVSISGVEALIGFSCNGKGTYCVNGAGMRLQVMEGDVKSKDIHFGKIWAFILQGAESRYICELICLCHDGGIPIYSYQYDGLITGQKIPAKIQQEAAKNSGLGNAAVLEIKAFERKIKIDNPNVPEGYIESLQAKYALIKPVPHISNRGTIYHSRGNQIKGINEVDKNERKLKIPQRGSEVCGDAGEDHSEILRGDRDHVEQCAWIRNLCVRLPYYSEADIERAGDSYSETNRQRQLRRHLEDLRVYPGDGFNGEYAA